MRIRFLAPLLMAAAFAAPRAGAAPADSRLAAGPDTARDAGPVRAAPADPKDLLKDPAFQEKLRRWRSMSDEDRARVRARYEQWKKLSVGQRETLQMSWSTFRGLPPDQQAAAKAWFRKLPDDQRHQLQLYASRAFSFARMHQIPLHQFTSWVRHVPREEIERIRQLPPGERADASRKLVRRFYEHVSRRVEAQIPESEREAYRKLPLDEMLARARKWFAERKAVDAEKRGQIPWWERDGATGGGRGTRGGRPADGRTPLPDPPPPAPPATEERR
jgi:hypothetical protein